MRYEIFFTKIRKDCVILGLLIIVCLKYGLIYNIGVVSNSSLSLLPKRRTGRDQLKALKIQI